MNDEKGKQIAPIYEHPLNERIRLLLRLELIFEQALLYQTVRDQYEAQMFLDTIFALLNLTNRYELRSEILKEIEVIRHLLMPRNKKPSLVMEHSESILEELAKSTETLHSIDSKYIDRLRNIDFLNTVKQRNIHDTGTYLFEIPELQFWLLQPASVRSNQVNVWLNDFLPFQQSITLLLNIIRTVTAPVKEVAEQGIYLKTIDHRVGVLKLLRIEILTPNYVYPRVSGSRHRFAIRFMQQQKAEERAKQIDERVVFNLQACIL